MAWVGVTPWGYGSGYGLRFSGGVTQAGTHGVAILSHHSHVTCSTLVSEPPLTTTFPVARSTPTTTHHPTHIIGHPEEPQKGHEQQGRHRRVPAGKHPLTHPLKSF